MTTISYPTPVPASFIDRALPWFLGHRTEIAGTLMVLLNAARLIAPLFGVAIPDIVSTSVNELSGVLGGATGLFAAARINRNANAALPHA